MKIAIFGAGYVGLINSVCYAKMGHTVDCYESNSEKLNDLKNDKLPIYEPGLNVAYLNHKNKITFCSIKDFGKTDYDFTIVCVGTPYDEKEIDISQIEAVFTVCKNNEDQTGVIIVRSTVPAGTTEKLTEKYGLKNKVLFSPEFLRAGTAIFDFMNPDRIIIGGDVDDTLKGVLLTLNDGINTNNTIYMSVIEAELCKQVSNTALALRVSFANEIAALSSMIGANIDKVMQGAGADTRIGGAFHKAGPGFGGSCFPKDVKGLVSLYDVYDIEAPIIQSIEKRNQLQIDKLYSLVTDHITDGCVVGILGIAFKAGTNDTRESISIKLIQRLIKDSCSVMAHDYNVVLNDLIPYQITSATFISESTVLISTVDILIVMHDLPGYKYINEQYLNKHITQSIVLIDPFRRYDKTKLDNNKIKHISM